MSLPWYSRGGLHIMEPSHGLNPCRGAHTHTAPCSNCSVASRPGVGGTVLTSAASSQPHDDHNVRSCPCDSQQKLLLRVPQPLALGGRPVRRGHTRAPPRVCGLVVSHTARASTCPSTSSSGRCSLSGSCGMQSWLAGRARRPLVRTQSRTPPIRASGSRQPHSLTAP